jgi:hypothetical protein
MSSARLTPITLLVDDPCPLVHVFREHWRDVHHKPLLTEDGRPLQETIPNSFLDRFCDVMERWSIRGKFSVVPAPAGKGDIVNGIEGYDRALTSEWIETVQRRVTPFCDICPEGLTHNLALNLETGECLPEGESLWSQHQTRETLTPYLTRELELMKQAGFDCTGVTSPWVFGIKVEEEYIASIVAAQKAVYDRDFSWYFLHMIYDRPVSRPWVAYKEDSTLLISIPANIDDHFWQTIDSPRTDGEYISSVADRFVTEDGSQGDILTVLDAGGWPIILTHWQSLFSNGLETGLVVLEEVGRRVEQNLSDRVRWMTCSELARMTVGQLP